jgi:hypothetical protein
MSLLGQLRHIQRTPKSNFVRYAPNSDHSTAEFVCPLSADFVAEVGHFGCEVPALVF